MAVEYVTTVHGLEDLKRVDAQLNDMAKVGWRLRFITEAKSTAQAATGWIILWERNQTTQGGNARW